MSDLETRQVRCFVAVAEELHFGRAAARLGVTQPGLSRTVARLERRLDTRLFDRTTRAVQLTAAGTVLYLEAVAVLRAITAAERRTMRAGQVRRSLVVALKPDGDAGLLPAILDRFERTPEALPCELALVDQPETVARLRDGRADVALLALPADLNGLDYDVAITAKRQLSFE